MWIDGERAWHNVLTTEHSRWEKIAARFNSDFMSLVTTPKFHIHPTDCFFCMGSCFARNLELEFVYRDLTVLSKRIISPKTEFAHRPTGVVNKYTTASMLNEFEWIVKSPPPKSILIEAGEGWADYQLTTERPVSLARAVER